MWREAGLPGGRVNVPRKDVEAWRIAGHCTSFEKEEGQEDSVAAWVSALRCMATGAEARACAA